MRLWCHITNPTKHCAIYIYIYIYKYDCRRFREDTSQNGDIILSNLLLLEISDFGSLLWNSWLFLLVASVKCLFWFYRNSVLSDFPCFFPLVSAWIIIFFVCFRTSHSKVFLGPTPRTWRFSSRRRELQMLRLGRWNIWSSSHIFGLLGSKSNGAKTMSYTRHGWEWFIHTTYKNGDDWGMDVAQMVFL